MKRNLSAWIAKMPKAEIHVHLEGTISPETLLTLAQRHNKMDALPSQDIANLQEWLAFSSFPDFIEKYMLISDLLRTPKDFRLIVEECGRDMVRQNILYRELTVTPYTHTHIQQKGLTFDDLFAGLEEGRLSVRENLGREIRWVFDIPRNACFGQPNSGVYDPQPAKETLTYALRGLDSGVVGFGLGGYEVSAPPEPFAHAFSATKEAGLRSVPHAGETEGPQSVWGAVKALSADRIGHGVRAIEDPNLLVLLRERQIPLEVNLTSNICLHVYRRLAEHPFPHLDRMGLLLTIGSDDPPLFSTNLTREYELLASEFGYSPSDIARIARNAFVASAAPPALANRLLADFDAWLTQHGSDTGAIGEDSATPALSAAAQDP